MNNWIKRNGTHLAVIGIFLAICFFFLTPAFQGKTLGQSDVIGAQSTQKEIMDYRAKDTTILWTNQIFGGMPAFQIWAPYPDNITTHIIAAAKAVFPNPVDTVLILLLGTYFLFTVLKLNPWLAAAGAVAFTFSSYNIILLVAGHSNQAFAIAFFAPILASIILTLRGNYIGGGALTAFFLAMEIRANHVQMTYYLMLAIFILIGIELYHAVKGKRTAAFLKALAYMAGATLLALAVNASILWSTYDYGKETIRGKSNLTQTTNEPSNGLDREYAYQWSQGVGECFTFLVPNAYGGGSGTERLDKNSATAKVFLSKGTPEDQAANYAQQISSSIPGMTTYWGNKPGTGGPYYFGAIICFLFVFGLIIVRSRLKWWLLATVLLTMFLSFGKNLPFLSDIFFNYFPLYNKFRAVESILAVAGLCFPILAFLAVRELLETKDKNVLVKKLMLALYITGGIALILVIYPELFLSFHSADQATGINYLTQVFKGDSTLANEVASAIVKDRISLERADAIRSLIFILVTFGLLWAFIKQKVNVTVMSIGLFAITLIDLWQVDKRYLKDEIFQDKVEASQVVAPREVDQIIMKDPDPDFRVFDASADFRSDTFNPFFHKSITGYSAARLKRYEELFLNQFTKSINQDVLDMLNTKYIITTDQKSGTASMHANSTACGHAWFVNSVKYVDNADEEMLAISSFDPKDEAMVDKQYKSLVEAKTLGADANATIDLVSYNPDHLVYQSSSAANRVAIFSEIYYSKGWKMLIDGVEQPYYRADYLLRAATIPLGNHKIEFIFHPASYYTGETISLIGSILLILALAGAVFNEVRKKKPAIK
ncbi:YfhO family protein [Mucilaginibacter segetis]|uniref:YfhO family protein n=1 Tax=Mucilaginibacter segetis TaxID=2793071 RepID=A0A934PNW1_9SPHI|nr:YfhO family protein [Mucilaginibacter segetis]MBK0378018.1 YfhO family protein [Mucilaginibacter segetis]